jgi:hypothetical protein
MTIMVTTMRKHTSDVLLTVMAMLAFAFVVAVSLQQSKVSTEPGATQIATKGVGRVPPAQ